MGYQPIEDYGVIGDTRTVALVGKNGSIDWFCFPNFDSPSVFAKILDDNIGGHFSIAPVDDDVTLRQFYWPDTNVLITRFMSPEGVAEITDFMPITEEISRDINRCIARRVTMIRGSMQMQMECFPAFNYARDSHSVELSADGAAFHSPDLNLGLATSLDLREQENGVVAEFTLEEDHDVIVVLREIEPEEDCGMAISPEQSFEDFQETVDYWRNWLSQSTYTGRWREMVHRSALALKLMTFEPTGAIVAAPTCSLPEAIGGERNWDYRYTWIRDAAFTLYGLLRIGFTEEAGRFMNYIEARSHELGPDGSLQIMYGIDGRHELTEETLDHLDGYRGSKPVRIGNGAYDQLQLDIYGELMDSVYLFNKYGTPISYDLWTHLRRLVDWIAENWDRKDEGIWEVRGGQKHFVYSKLMAWVALDRAVRLADKRSFPAERTRWLNIRDTIYEDIMDKGWNDELEAFVQSYGSDNLDAANLMMPLVFFLSPNDPRMISTLDAINRSPEDGGLVSNSLVYRYNAHEAGDDLEGKEGTFNICTFWLVEAMTRAGRRDPKRLDEARLIFEQMLGYANHLGLYAEETGPCGEALGNFPQAFTHLALISAAFNLDRELGE